MTDRPTFTTIATRRCLGYQAVGTAVFETWDDADAPDGGDVIKVWTAHPRDNTTAAWMQAAKAAEDMAVTLNARML